MLPVGPGFSCEVNFFRSSVAETNRVFQMKTVETTRATVQAVPPSIPYAAPVSHAGPKITFQREAGAVRYL